MCLSTRQPRLSSTFNFLRSPSSYSVYTLIHIHSDHTNMFTPVYVSESGCVSVCPFHSPHFNQQIIKSLAEEALTTTPNISYICMYCHVQYGVILVLIATPPPCFSFSFSFVFFLNHLLPPWKAERSFHIGMYNSPSGINAFLHYHTNPPSFLSPWRTRLLMTSSDCYIFFFTDKASTTNILNGRNQLAAFDTAYSKVSFFPTKFCHLPVCPPLPIQDVDIQLTYPKPSYYLSFKSSSTLQINYPDYIPPPPLPFSLHSLNAYTYIK